MRIVVRGTNWVGDAIMSVPALTELRRIFPGSHIALQTRAWAKDIFDELPIFDQIITLDRSGSVLKDALTLRKGNFDLAVVLPNSFSSALVPTLAGVRRRFGYSTDGRSLLLTDRCRVPDWKSERHEVNFYLNLVDELRKRFTDAAPTEAELPEISLPVNNERRSEAESRLASLGIAKDAPTVMFAAGSTNSNAKRWGAESYAGLADRLAKDISAQILLLGAPGEEPVAQKIIAMSQSRLTDLTGCTTLAEAAALIACADLFISNDMGLAHLAPAVGTPTLVIFGPTDHVTTRPFSSIAEVIRAGVDCSPCMLRECPIDHRCMTRVTVEQVFAAAAARLKGWAND